MHCGLVHIYQGDGKGKTTAAVGLAIRAVGAGFRVGYASFLKDGTSSELPVLETLDGITVYPCKCDIPFTFCMNDCQKSEAISFYEDLLQQIRCDYEQYDLLVLDEVLDAVHTGLLDESLLLSVIDGRPSHTELVLTGRCASDTVTKRAQYLTQMTAVSHPFDSGVPARRGIEY